MSSLPSEGIKDLLVAAGLGVFQPSAADTDWVIVISRMRAAPNKMIAIYDTGGRAPEPGLDINYPTVQIVVRGEPDGYVDAGNKSLRIRDELLGRPRGDVNGDVWASITMVGDIIPLGYDDNECPQFGMNFQLIVHQGDLTYSHRQSTGL